MMDNRITKIINLELGLDLEEEGVVVSILAVEENWSGWLVVGERDVTVDDVEDDEGVAEVVLFSPSVTMID